MQRFAWAPRSIDISVPSVARIHDFYLGGAHNFAADRATAREAMAQAPGLPQLAQAGRAFTRRAVAHASGLGITQFLDIGSGIPGGDGVREAARRHSPHARVVHVDHDPVAVSHGRAALAGDPLAACVAGDLRHPEELLADPELHEVLDLDRPVALLLIAILHFVADEDDPYGAVARLRDALAPGSVLALAHASAEGAGPEGVARVYENIRNPLILRSRDDIARFFEGYDMVQPGLVPMPRWRPQAPVDDEGTHAFGAFAGVGTRA